jgi:hypothetical protein
MSESEIVAMLLTIRRFRSELHRFLRIDTAGDMNGNVFSETPRDPMTTGD